MVSSARLAFNQNHKVDLFHGMHVEIARLRKKRRKRPEEILHLKEVENTLNGLLDDHEPPYTHRKTVHYSVWAAVLVAFILCAITYFVYNVG